MTSRDLKGAAAVWSAILATAWLFVAFGLVYLILFKLGLLLFLPRDALQWKERSCDRMSSVRPSVRLSVPLSVTLVDCDHIG